jgi:hypothetical protein
MLNMVSRRRALATGGVTAAGVIAGLSLPGGSAQAASSQNPTQQQILAAFEAHVQAETVQRSVSATMATVAANPFWEFEPVGYQVNGTPGVTEMYARLIANFFPLFVGATQRGMWLSDNGLVVEDLLTVNLPNGTQLTTPVTSIFVVAGDLIASERVYLGAGVSELVVDSLGPRFADIPGATVA